MKHFAESILQTRSSNMKQTKKISRSQRVFLQRHGVDITGCRLIEDTKQYIKILKADGVTIQVIMKDGDD